MLVLFRLIVLSIALVLSAAPSHGFQAAPKRQRTQPVPETKEQTVYITKTGRKYHADGCQYLRRSQIPMSLKQAKAQGYTPCSRCPVPE